MESDLDPQVWVRGLLVGTTLTANPPSLHSTMEGTVPIQMGNAFCGCFNLLTHLSGGLERLTSSQDAAHSESVLL